MVVPAFHGPPLVVPELVFAKHLFDVHLRLDEPMVRPLPELGPLLAACAVCDTAIERVLRVPGANFDTSLLHDVEARCQQVAPGQAMQDVLEELGILSTFPYLRQGLSGEDLWPVSSSQGSNYLAYISQLNQVVMMSTQLYHDACIPQHHKYVAHQAALLYQSLNQLQGETKPIRRLIEARFDTIKQLTESKNPSLDIELSHWLQEVTWTCREEVKSFPRYIHKRMQPVVGLMRTGGRR